jgi:hypothetical protein
MKTLFQLFLVCFLYQTGFAGTITSTSTGGNWSATSTWVGNAVPAANDDVVIAGTVSVNANVAAKTITVNSTKTLSFANGGYTLTLSGNFTNNGNFIAGDGTVKFTNGGVSGTVAFNNVIIDGKTQFNFGGSATVNGRLKLINNADMAYSNSNHPFYGTNAVLDVNGTYNPSTNPFLWVNSNSTLAKIAPNIVISGGTITASQGQTFLKGTFTVESGATFNGSVGCIFMISGFQSITNNGTLSLGGVTVQNGATWNVNANYSLATLKIESGATVNANSYVLTINNASINNCGGVSGIMQLMPGGTFNAGTSTVVFNPAYYSNVSADVSGPINFTNMVVTGNNTINVPTANTVTVSGNVTVNSGATVGNTTNIVFDSTASVTNNNPGTTTFPPTIPATPATSGVYLTGSVSGSKAGAASIQAGNVATLTGNITINSGASKTLTVSPGAELNLGTYTVTADTVYIYGKISTASTAGLAGAFTRSSGSPVIMLGTGSTVYYNSGSTQTITPRSDYVHLILSNSGTKRFAAGHYAIAGDFTSSGGSIDITTNATTFSFDGNASQTIQGLPYRSPSFSGSGTKTLTDTTKVTGVVSISGNANLVSNGLLTLTSTASGTASIGAIAATATVTGNVNYERYIPGLRQWRFIGWPVSGNTFANSWQNSIYITGPGTGGSIGTTNSNGFDWTSNSSASLYYYNETAPGSINAKWTVVPNTATAINPFRGYRLFIRGDRAQGTGQLTGTTYTAGATTLRGTGTIIKGDTTITLTCSNGCNATNDGWNLIANPYPSAINWNNSQWVSARSSNIKSTIYIYNAAGNNYATWSPTGGSINGGSSNIGSGQSFWVKSTGTTSLAFKETYKVNNATVGFFGKTGSAALPDNLKLKIGDSTTTYDECVVYMYPNATLEIDESLDAGKLDPGTSRIATTTQANSTSLMFNAIPLLSGDSSDTIQVVMPLANSTRTYLLGFEGLGSFTDPTTQVFLKDAYTNTISLLNPAVGSYPFETYINEAPSFAGNRFSIIFTTTSSALPVKLTAFNAGKLNEDVEVKWSTSSETNNKQFDIERSTDGQHFETIGMVRGAGNSQKLNNYRFVDENPVTGLNYYRLKQTDYDNHVTYSPIVLVSFGNQTQSALAVYPIPAGNKLTLETAGKPGHLEVVDVLGQIVASQTLSLTGSEQIDLQVLPTGIYYLRVYLAGESPQTVKFLKN